MIFRKAPRCFCELVVVSARRDGGRAKAARRISRSTLAAEPRRPVVFPKHSPQWRHGEKTWPTAIAKGGVAIGTALLIVPGR